MTRKFEDFEAVREKVPLLVGLFGVSGSGKTYSALRLASGIQKVTGGDIYVVDTESRRALAYSSYFRFRHVPFSPPFSPADYQAAIEHCVTRGAKTIVVDSFSLEHEGQGGVLEMHDEFLKKRAGDDWKKREKLTFSAWIEPKRQRARLIQYMLQCPVNFVLCFRSKEKLRIVRGKDPENIGFMPIGGEEYLYEMTVSALLPPNSQGIPEWNPQASGSRMITKLPRQFRELLSDGKPLSESHGEALAKWAAGDSVAPERTESAANDLILESMLADYQLCTTDSELEPLEGKRRDLWPSLTKTQKTRLKKAADAAIERVNDRRGDAYEEPTGS